MGIKERRGVKVLAILVLFLDLWRLWSMTRIDFFKSFYPPSLWLSFYWIALFLALARLICALGILKFNEQARHVLVHIVMVSILMTCVSFFVQQQDFIKAYITDYDGWVRKKVSADFEHGREDLNEDQKNKMDLEIERAVAYADRLCLSFVNGFLAFIRVIYILWYAFLVYYFRKSKVKAEFS
ncbi:MAG: hypothetical protein K8S27_15825 [Candidatus Omnitrophica bacterium]|nr:hypothetical protein [Candidatus Omnitrophota bacterium]